MKRCFGFFNSHATENKRHTKIQSLIKTSIQNTRFENCKEFKNVKIALNKLRVKCQALKWESELNGADSHAFLLHSIFDYLIRCSNQAIIQFNIKPKHAYYYENVKDMLELVM